jgi:tetratricopeptide (TPR) repeat protein
VDPGDELRGAYQDVLQQTQSQSAAARESPLRGADGHEPGEPPAGPLVRLRPAQLFPDLPHFAGRDEAMRRARTRIKGQAPSNATPVLVIDGLPGIGKTSLAIHLAHELADAYPDGQLCADLRGLDPNGAALRSNEVVKAFLNALGVRDSEIPASDLARFGLYRSVLAGRRILIVLDNARDADQVRSLLPGAQGCLVLVTSRSSLMGLAAAQGAQTLTLDLPSMAEARQLLSSRIGATRASADPRAVDEIIDLCGRLPLALAIVAARASTHPDHRLTTIARELRQAHGSLDGFAYHGPENDLRVIFSWSYRMLTPSVAQVFRLLSLHPGSEATLPAIASLIGLPLRDTRALIGELMRSRLLTEHQPGRYSSHDLIRAYARELVFDHESETERGEATDRLLAHYRQTAYDANLYLIPEIDADPPSRIDRVTNADFTGANDAINWFNTERHVLKAVMRWAIDMGRVTDAWQLELTVQGFYQREGWWHEWATVVRECLDAATAAGDSPGRAEMMRSLAGALYYLGDRDSARALLEDALKIFTDMGNLSRQALTLRNLGQVHFARHEYQQSVARYDHALRIFESLDDLASQVDVLCGLADAQDELDTAGAGFATIGRALAISRALADDVRQGECLINRAERLLLQKDYSASLADWTTAEEIFHKADYRVNSIKCNLGLGDTALAMGDRGTARRAWLKALALLNDSHASEEADIRARLAKLRPHGSTE